MSKSASTLDKAKRNSVLKYLLSGTTAFGLDYILLITTYYVIGLPLAVATSIGFISGFLVSFSLNRQWVFPSGPQRNIRRQVIEYIALLVFNYFFTVWGVSFLNDHGVSPAIGKLGIMALIVCWNYALFRWVIFAKQSNRD